jgi:thiamine kinase-like enzyme
METIKESLSDIYPNGQWDIQSSSIGASKQAFIASNGEQKAFVKLDVLAPILIRLSELGVAPRVLSEGLDGGKPYIIQEFVEGRKADKDWYAQNVETLARFIKRYHQDPRLKEILKDGQETSYSENITIALKGLYDDIEESNSDLLHSQEVKDMVVSLKERAKQLEPTPLVPIHKDPNPSNLLITKDGLVMVDWDDIRLSDPMQDISLILWWYIPHDKWRTFFEAYGGKMDEEKIRWWIARNTLSIASWYGKQGNSEYVDFFVKDASMALQGENNSQIFVNNTI